MIGILMKDSLYCIEELKKLMNKNEYELCPKCGSQMKKQREIHDELGTHYYDIEYWECTNQKCKYCMTN